MKQTIQTALAAFSLLFTTLAEAKAIRATEMTSSQWSEFYSGKSQDLVVEFREGDELPVSLEAEGDLVATRQASTTYINVKKNFWMRLSQNDVVMSFDGQKFLPINKLITGSFTAGVNRNQGDEIANSIQLRFSAFLRP